MYKNMKIAITDSAHLQDVCDVLESMGYKDTGYINDNKNFIYTYEHGEYHGLFSEAGVGLFKTVTLTDLLKMRDDMVKANANSR